MTDDANLTPEESQQPVSDDTTAEDFSTDVTDEGAQGADEAADGEAADGDEAVDEPTGVDRLPRTIWWEDDTVQLIDQSRLPLVGDVLVCDTAEGVCWAIHGMAVRGAPALGVAAALAVALWARNEADQIDRRGRVLLQALRGRRTRSSPRDPRRSTSPGEPSAMRQLAYRNEGRPLDELREIVVAEALKMVDEDEERNRRLGEVRSGALRRRHQGAHPLQRRLACDGVLWHGARRHLHRARAGQDRARVGR